MRNQRSLLVVLCFSLSSGLFLFGMLFLEQSCNGLISHNTGFASSEFNDYLIQTSEQKLSPTISGRFFFRTCSLNEKNHSVGSGSNKTFRTFTDKTGKHKIQAHLLKYEKEQAYLEKKDGSIKKVSIDKFGSKDRAWIRSESRRRKAALADPVVRYRWPDPHALQIKKWVGDQATGTKIKLRPLRTHITINRRRLNEAIESYGLPTDWDLSEQWVRADAALRGIKISKVKTGKSLPALMIEPDYLWIVKHSKNDVKSITRKLNQVAKKAEYETHREWLSVFTSFCQGIRYATPNATRTSPTHGIVKTVGVSMPIETLYKKKGDCDTKSLLFAAMMANIPGQNVVLFVGEKGFDHVYVGVRQPARPRDHVIKLQGAKYVLIEMTEPWPIGRIPMRQLQHTRQNKYRPVKVVSN